MQELKFELLEKTITLEAADYSDCPAEHLQPLKDLKLDGEDIKGRQNKPNIKPVPAHTSVPLTSCLTGLD